MANISISAASKNDIPVIIKCSKSSLPIYYSKVQLEDFLTLKDHKIIIVKIYNQFAGFVVLKIENQDRIRNIHILSIAIDNNVRNKGVGTYLFNNLKSIYKNCSITLYVQTSNFTAVNFYFKQYFKIVNYNPNYYKSLSDKGCYYMKYNP